MYVKTLQTDKMMRNLANDKFWTEKFEPYDTIDNFQNILTLVEINSWCKLGRRNLCGKEIVQWWHILIVYVYGSVFCWNCCNVVPDYNNYTFVWFMWWYVGWLFVYCSEIVAM
jgi:hypothetical protein